MFVGVDVGATCCYCLPLCAFRVGWVKGSKEVFGIWGVGGDAVLLVRGDLGLRL